MAVETSDFARASRVRNGEEAGAPWTGSHVVGEVAPGPCMKGRGPLGHQEVQIWPPPLVSPLPGPVSWLELLRAP